VDFYTDCATDRVPAAHANEVLQEASLTTRRPSRMVGENWYSTASDAITF